MINKATKFSVAVCDNDKETADDIKNLILRHNGDATVSVFLSAEELLEEKEFFHIYFLDIKGISGMELARKIREQQEKSRSAKSIIVFVTGFSEYMAEAFDVQAFHYLLKPLNEEKFREVLEKAAQEATAMQRQEESCVLLKIMGRKTKIPLQNVFYAESAGKKVLIHTTQGVYEVSGKMEEFETIFGDSFYRCHRCYLVNFAKISSYGQNEIETLNGDKILLARKKYPAFVKAYLAYAKRGGIVNV